MASPKTLLVFIDGLGLGSEDPAVNPIYGGAHPCLERLLREVAVPVDAGLGVPGTPQSATGQATLLTGVNAARALGRHVEAFPGRELREIIREHNVFAKLTARGYRSTFANAYYLDDVTEVQKRKRQSVTTVATLGAFGSVRDAKAMQEGRAVYQDLTRERLRKRGYQGPLIAPRDAAGHLQDIAAEHDFTLFEFFQTDLAAHRGQREDVDRVLGQLDEFLESLLPWARDEGHLLVLTSDHGNIEDLGSPKHTDNPVPFVALGVAADALRERVRSLEDFVPALLDLYPPK